MNIILDLNKQEAYQLAVFLGVQGIEDTREIIEKYNLDMNDNEMEDILQYIFNELSCELNLEL